MTACAGFGLRAGAAALVALGLLIGCAEVQRKLSPAAPGEGAPASAAPSPRPSVATKPDPRQDAAIKAGKDSRPMASWEPDALCTKLVAPFSLTDNTTILTELGTQGGFDTLNLMFDQWVQGTSSRLASQRAVSTARHNVSYKLRAQAVRMNWLPMEAEVFYGQTQLEAMRKAGKIEPNDTRAGKRLYPLAEALLAQTLQGVDEPHDYAFEVHVGTEAGDNAMSLPGGIIVVDQALLSKPEFRKKAQFAMAHEIAHILQRHETRAVQARIIDTVSLRASLPEVAKVMGEAKSDPKAVVTLALAGKLVFERHYGNQELHSDGCATRVLQKTLSSEAQLIDVLQAFVAGLPQPTADEKPDPTAVTGNLGKTAKELDGLIDLVTRPIDRHPTTKERVDNLNNTLADLRKRAPKATPKAGPGASKVKAPAPTKNAKPTGP